VREPRRNAGTIPIAGSGETERAAVVVRAGGIVAYATESFYALGADPLQPAALEALLRLKGRDRDKPVALIAGSTGDVERFFPALSPAARRLAEAFWPGPLTLLLDADDSLPMAVRGHGGKVGVRIPGFEPAAALARACGGLLTATSANRAGEPPPISPQQVEEGLSAAGQEGVDLILDGGTTQGGSPSTLVDPSDVPARIVRPGRISPERLAAVLGYAVSLPR
jgi:L-threonylcarbamoyladenylate synthase